MTELTFAAPPLELDRRERRLAKVMRQIKSARLAACLISHLPNIRYLTGFTGSSAALLLTAKSALLLSDGRYGEQLQSQSPGIPVEIRPVTATLEAFTAEVVAKSGWEQLGFEPGYVTWSTWNALRCAVSAELVPLPGLVEGVRAIKDQQEIDQTRQAVSIAERAFRSLQATIQPGETEIDLRNRLEATMRNLGAERPAFDSIIAAGAKSALPHAQPGPTRIAGEGWVLLDWGAALGSGYRSDLTRILTTAKVSPKLQKAFGVVKSAADAAIAAIRPGADLKAIDSAARAVIDGGGFRGKFGHGLGHGLGLEIHEAPRMSPAATGTLEKGMIVTVEPGVYLPGWGGIRLEDDVLVTADGCEVLSSLPRELEELAANC